jgi:hypothetical protein
MGEGDPGSEHQGGVTVEAADPRWRQLADATTDCNEPEILVDRGRLLIELARIGCADPSSCRHCISGTGGLRSRKTWAAGHHSPGRVLAKPIDRGALMALMGYANAPDRSPGVDFSPSIRPDFVVVEQAPRSLLADGELLPAPGRRG